MVDILVIYHFCHCNQSCKEYTCATSFQHLHIYQWNKYLEIYSKAAPCMSTECQTGDSQSGLQMLKLHTQVTSHKVVQQCMIRYCEPQIMAVEINSQEKNSTATRESCNPYGTHLTLKSQLLSALSWGLP